MSTSRAPPLRHRHRHSNNNSPLGTTLGTLTQLKQDKEMTPYILHDASFASPRMPFFFPVSFVSRSGFFKFLFFSFFQLPLFCSPASLILVTNFPHAKHSSPNQHVSSTLPNYTNQHLVGRASRRNASAGSGPGRFPAHIQQQPPRSLRDEAHSLPATPQFFTVARQLLVQITHILQLWFHDAL